jgi:predicted XRE-type DNA-binding protein
MSDADTRLAKARLAQKITAVMHEHNLTQDQIADKLGIDQPQVSKLTRGHLKNFSLDKLLTLVTRLDLDVAINITHNPEPTRPARLTVSYSDERLVAAGERHSRAETRFD